MNSNFEYYKVFYFVSKYNNLTRAANALRTSQPAVTRTIRNLEAELGCRLFVRSKNGMTHTPEGAELFRYVSEGCAKFFQGENALSSMLSLEKGSIYISATETALQCYLFEAMEEFNVKYPDVHFKILNNSSSDSIRMIKEGHVDMAIISAPIKVECPLKQVVLRKYRDILIGGNKYEAMQGRELSLYQLMDQPWISLTAGSFTRRFLEDYFKKNKLTFEPNVEVDTTDMIMMAVKHNLGIGFIPPEFAKDYLEMGEVVEICVNEPFPDREITMIYDAESPQSIAAKRFRAFLKERQSAIECRESGFRIF